MSLTSAIFLDRDGTLIEEKHHLRRVQDIVVLPGAIEAVRRINGGGIKAVVVTNQSAVARGLLTEDELAVIHATLTERFAREGARLDGIYYCPHHPEAGQSHYTRQCDCRKPGTGLLKRAAYDLKLDLTSSTMIGDTLEDVKAGQRAGCRSVLVRTGYGRCAETVISDEKSSVRPDRIADNVFQAVTWALEEAG